MNNIIIDCDLSTSAVARESETVVLSLTQHLAFNFLRRLPKLFV